MAAHRYKINSAIIVLKNAVGFTMVKLVVFVRFGKSLLGNASTGLHNEKKTTSIDFVPYFGSLA